MQPNPTIDAFINANPAPNSPLGQSQTTDLTTRTNGVSNVAGIPSTSPISSSALTPTQPLNLPTSTYPTSAAGLQGLIQSTTQNTINSLQPAIDKGQAVNDYLSSQLGDVYNQIATKPQATETAYANEGVDQKKQALSDINNQILGETNALNQQKDTIYNAPGVTREAANNQFSEIQRISLGKQADLAVVQSAASNNYANAQAIADRKVQMQFEGYQNKLDALKFFYQNNKDTLSKAQDQQFQQKIKQQDTQLQVAMDQAKTLQDTKLSILKDAQENGAPTNVLTSIQGAQNPEAATAAAGNWLGKVDREYKQAQSAKLYSDIKATGGANSILSSNDIKATPYNQQFIDVSSYKGKDLQTAITEANKAGVPVIKDAKDANSLDSLNTALNNLSELQKQFETLAPSNVFSRGAEKISRPFGAIFNTDTNSKLKAYNANREALIQQINALAGSNPRISRETLNLALNAIPKLDYTSTDTLKDGKNKLALTRKYLTNAQDSILGIHTTDNQIKYGGMSLQTYYGQATPEQKAAVEKAIQQFPNYSADEIMQIITQ